MVLVVSEDVRNRVDQFRGRAQQARVIVVVEYAPAALHDAVEPLRDANWEPPHARRVRGSITPPQSLSRHRRLRGEFCPRARNASR